MGVSVGEVNVTNWMFFHASSKWFVAGKNFACVDFTDGQDTLVVDVVGGIEDNPPFTTGQTVQAQWTDKKYYPAIIMALGMWLELIHKFDINFTLFIDITVSKYAFFNQCFLLGNKAACDDERVAVVAKKKAAQAKAVRASKPSSGQTANRK